MAQVKAGVAYVDVRLGSVEQFKNNLKDEVEKAFSSVGKNAGEQISKNISPQALTKIGQRLDQELSKAFFADAKNEFVAGFRALANRDLASAGELFKSAGNNFGNALYGGLRTIGLKAANGIDAVFRNIGSTVSTVSSAIGRGFTTAITKLNSFSGVLDKASQKMGFLSFQIQNFGILATAAFTAPVAAATTLATVIGVKTAAQLESATNALKYLLPAGVNVERLLERLKKIAIESPIFDTTDLIQYTQKFTAAGVEVGKTERFLKAFSNIALVTGANTDEANRAIVAITQAFGKGKLQSEELNQQLGEAMPAALKLLRDGLGVTQAELNEMVKSGQISGDDLIDVFTKIGESKKFVDGAADGAKTLNGVFQELKETLQTQLGQFFLDNSQQIKDAVAKLGPALSQLITEAGPIFLKLIGWFTKLVDYFSRAVDWYSKLSPGTQDLILKIIGIGTALGPVVIILGSFLGALAGIAAGVAALTSTVGLVVVGIVAVGAAFTAAFVWFKNFISKNDEVRASIKNTWDDFYAKHLGPVVDAFKSFWANVVQAFNQVKNAITGNSGAWSSWGTGIAAVAQKLWIIIKQVFFLIVDLFGTIVDTLGSVVKAIGSLISGIIKIFAGLTDFLIGVFTGDWKRALDGLKEIWDGLWDAVVGTLANVGEAIWKLVKGIVMGIINFFKGLYDEMVGHSIVPDLVNAVIMWFNKLTAPIRSVFNAISSIVKGFASVVSSVVTAISNGVSKIIGYFRDLPGKITSAISSLAGTLKNFGENAMRGFLNGITSIGSKVIDKARSIADSVKNAVSSVLKIGSPSKVFTQYGKWVVQGFVNGMSAEQRNLSNSLAMFGEQPRFQQINGDPSSPIAPGNSPSSALSIENYYANDQVDPWRQAEDWYFIVTSRGGAA